MYRSKGSSGKSDKDPKGSSVTSQQAEKLGIHINSHIKLLEDELLRKIKELEEMGSAFEQVKLANKALEEDLSQKNGQVQQISDQMLVYEKRIFSFEEEFQKVNQEKRQSQEEIQKLKNEKALLIKENKKMKEENWALRAEILQVTDEKSQLKDICSKLKIEVKKRSDSLSILKAKTESDSQINSNSNNTSIATNLYSSSIISTQYPNTSTPATNNNNNNNNSMINNSGQITQLTKSPSVQIQGIRGGDEQQQQQQSGIEFSKHLSADNVGVSGHSSSSSSLIQAPTAFDQISNNNNNNNVFPFKSVEDNKIIGSGAGGNNNTPLIEDENYFKNDSIIDLDEQQVQQGIIQQNKNQKKSNKLTFSYDSQTKSRIEEAAKSIVGSQAQIFEDEGKQLKVIDLEELDLNKRSKATRKKAHQGDKKSVFTPRNIYEDFLIIGLNMDDIREFKTEFGDNAEGHKPARVLWNFGSKDSLKDGPKKAVQDFVYPFGVKVTDITNDEKKVSSLREKVIFKERNYRKRFCFPLLPGDEDIINSQWDYTIEVLNSHHLVYFVCISTNDYIVLEQDSKEYYYEVSITFCFMTYFPIISLFYGLIKSIMHQLRYSRKNIYIANPDDNQRCDFESSLLNFQDNLEEILHTLRVKYSVPTLGKKYEVLIETPLDKPISSAFFLPNAEEAFSVESLWGSFITFSYLSFKDIKFLVSAVMLEKKLIIFSSNKTLLTAVLSTLLSIIKPFKYTYPVIFNLPEILLNLCDAPGAALIGINQTEEFFWQEQLLESFPDCVFIFLDSKKIYALDSEVKISKMPIFNDYDSQLQSIYFKINDQQDTMKSFLSYTKINKYRASLSNQKSQSESSSSYQINPNVDWELQRTTPTSSKQFQSQLIFKLFHQTFEEKIVKQIINYRWLQFNEEELTRASKEIVQQYKYRQSKGFLKEFVNSQLFLFFTEIIQEKAKKMSQSTIVKGSDTNNIDDYNQILFASQIQQAKK